MLLYNLNIIFCRYVGVLYETHIINPNYFIINTNKLL